VRFGPRPESPSHERLISRVHGDRQQRRVPSGHDEDGGVHRRPWPEARRREPSATAELPPRSPTGAEKVRGRTVSCDGACACHLPLEDEVGPLQPAHGRVEEPTKHGTRDAEGEIGEHAIGIGREWRVQRVGAQHRDVADGRIASRQDRDELGIELDCQHLSRAARERIRERAAPRAELDDTIVASDAGVGDELRSEARATEEVLAEPTPPGASGRYVPGHGRPRPWGSLRGERALEQTAKVRALDFRRGRRQAVCVRDRTSSALSWSAAAAMFSSRCATEPVPGMGSIAGERASSQASRT
jgi:hypothetical protein